ncbi:hypothetical protein [Kitasatospora sp. NPDC056184]|uniref:hypothetical protein n=1 Tax=Kitasatospora sp. NPDC056184 TaxID=3345738 RepID=UPI0035D90CCF
MRSSVRTKFTRFLAVPAVAAAGVLLATAPAHANPVSISGTGATVADAGRTLNVTVTYQCSPSSDTATITVKGTQSAVSGRGTIKVLCSGTPRTATVPVTTDSTGQAWARDAVDLSLYIVDEHLTRTTTTTRIVAK